MFHSQSISNTALFVQNLTEGCWLNFMSPVVKSCKLYSHDWLSLPSSRDPPPSFPRFSPLFPHRPKLPRDPLHLLLLRLCLVPPPHSVSAPSHLACARFLIKRRKWQSSLSKLPMLHRCDFPLYSCNFMGLISASRQPGTFPGKTKFRGDGRPSRWYQFEP